MRVKVYKESDNPNTFNTPVKDLDWMPYLPQVGKQLRIESNCNPHHLGINTSLVTDIKEEGHYIHIKTLNSEYKIYKEPY